MAEGKIIHFNSLNVNLRLHGKRPLKSFLILQAEKSGFQVTELSFTFMDDESVLKLNKTHLNHDFYTDIITFDLSSNKKEILGDIYISIARVKDNANKHRVPFKEELHRVIFHGLLHLIGYTDKDPKSKKKMRAMEEEWLREYFVPRGTGTVKRSNG